MTIEALGRRYGARWALRELDLEVRRGEIVALVGPNGSGKTTLLRILAGFQRPTEGTVRLFGKDPWLDRVSVMEQARFAFAPPALYPGLTANEHLTLLPSTPASPRERDRVLEWVGLSERAHEAVRNFSLGMRQRLSLALALIPVPDLLVLDEPADGLDPLAVIELRERLLELRQETSLSILLSSHLLADVEQVADRICILHEGHAVFTGNTEELETESQEWRLVVSDVAAAWDALSSHFPLVRQDSDAVYVPWERSEPPLVREALEAAGVRLLEFHRVKPTLEAAFLKLLRQRLDSTPTLSPDR